MDNDDDQDTKSDSLPIDKECAVNRTAVHPVNPKMKNRILCEICTKPVIKIAEDQKVCDLCKDFDTEPILAAREQEDWGGLTSLSAETKARISKRQAKYVGKNQKTLDLMFMEDAHVDVNKNRISILKNGNSLTLQAQNIDGKEITLINTCAFDSVAQIFIVFIHDVPQTVNHLKDSKNEFLCLIPLLTKKITAAGYKKRAHILYHWKKATDPNDASLKKNNCLLLCNSNVGALASYLFRDFISITQIRTCDNKQNQCPSKTRDLRVISIQNYLLSDKTFENIIRDHVYLHDTRKCKCGSPMRYRFTDTGPFVIFEVWDEQNIGSQIQLRHIPSTIKNPVSSQDLKLVGIVNFIKNEKADGKTTKIENDGLNHYTAFVLRASGHWVEYNDLCERECVRASDYTVDPHLLVYVNFDYKQ